MMQRCISGMALALLGAAALAGTSFPVNRDMTAAALGFECIWRRRVEFEHVVVAGHDQPGRAGSGFAYPDRGRISMAPRTPPHRMSSSDRMWPRDDRCRHEDEQHEQERVQALQHVQLLLLDRELKILHVAEVLLELVTEITHIEYDA